MGTADVRETGGPGSRRLGRRGQTIVAGLVGAAVISLVIVLSISAGTGSTSQPDTAAVQVGPVDDQPDVTAESSSGADATAETDNGTDGRNDTSAESKASDGARGANRDDESTPFKPDTGADSEAADSTQGVEPDDGDADSEGSDTPDQDAPATEPVTRVEALTAVDYSCPDGAAIEVIADAAICYYNETRAVNAVAHTVSSCPNDTLPIHDDASGELTGCAKSTGADTVPALEEVHYQCPPGTGPAPTPQETCAKAVEGKGEVEAIVTIELSCPDGYSLKDDECRDFVIHSPTESEVMTSYGDCPEGWVEYDAYSCEKWEFVAYPQPAQVIETLQCPVGSKPAGLQCKDLATGELVEGRIVNEFTCSHIDGGYGQPTAADPTCLLDGLTNVGSAEKPNESVYSCPETHYLDPNDNYNCVGKEEYVYSPTLETVAYSCPPGSAGSPSADDPTCATPTIGATEYVPVDVVTTYRCPLGSTGQPTTENPICIELSPNYERIDPIETTTYSCPDGASGRPTASSPICQVTKGTSGAALETTIYSCPAGSSGTPTAADPTCVRA